MILKQAKDKEAIKKLGAADMRKAYEALADDYNLIMDRSVLLCPKCGSWLLADTYFYKDRRYAANRFPICKKCMLRIVEQRKTDKDEPNETKESVQAALHFMDRPYLDKIYTDCIKHANDDVDSMSTRSPWAAYISTIFAFPQYSTLTWKDSKFADGGVSEDEEEIRIIQKTVKNGKKIFGSGYSDEDYMFLMGQYEDWEARTQVDSKSQETYIMQICLQLLDIDKDRKANKDVTNKLKALDVLMNAANLQPKQNVNNSADDYMSVGQWIEKIETTRPISEPDEEFKDVNHIGNYIRVWFTGCLMKALGLKNSYLNSQEFLQEIEKYTVHKPETVDDNTENDVYSSLFGKVE